MKKGIAIFLAVLMSGIFFPCFADRNKPTIAGYSSTALIKRGDWKIYRITFMATANSGFFTIYDCLTLATTASTNAKAEGSEATSKNGKTLSFVDKPLEGSTGMYLEISNATVLIEYE